MVTAERQQRGDNRDGRESIDGQRSSLTAGQEHGALDSAPVDVGNLRFDEWLLDALGGANPDVPARGEDVLLASLLLAWRRDVDATPIAELVDIDAAAAAIAQARHRPRPRQHLVPLASAAAVLVITFAGVGLAARDAKPGDLLWGLERMLYPGRAHAALAASQARIDLVDANAAFLHGDLIAAEAALQRAQQQIGKVDVDHGLHDLQNTQVSLAARVNNDPRPPTTQSAAAPATPRPPSPAWPPSAPPPSATNASTTASSAQSTTTSPPPTSSPAETASSRPQTPGT